MSEQPKPLSAEEVQRGLEEHYNCTTNEFGVVVDYEQEAIRWMCANVFRLFATLDAERARADAAERRVQKLKRAMEYVIERASEITSDHHRDDCPVDYGCESCRLGDIVNDAMSDGEIVAAQKSCEDWQECAGNLALAIRSAIHSNLYPAEVHEALAEFDRLASEATKGVEF